MRKKKILWMAAAALLALPLGAFTKMDVTRVLLMNDDTNETWAVSGQGYYNTNDEAEVYWNHSSEALPTATQSQPLWQLNVLPGITHTLYQNAYDEDVGAVKLKLWQLNKCRAGSPATLSNANPATARFASGRGRNFIPWSGKHSVAFTGSTLMSQTASFQFAGMISMLNSTNAYVVSPFYTDLGTIYGDAVNGWTACPVSFVIEVATETIDGNTFSATNDVDSLKWRAIPFTVFTVKGKTTVALEAEEVKSFTLNQNSTANANLWGGSFYRFRATLNWREAPIRFRIRRTSLDTTTSNEEGGVVGMIRPVREPP